MTIKGEFTIADFLARSGASAASIATYERQLAQCEGWLGKPLGRATERDVTDLKKKLRTMASARQYTTLLRMFYKSAKREDLRELLVLKQRLKRLNPNDILGPSEVQAMIEAAPSVRDRALIACLWDLGVRVHELLAVDLADIRKLDSPENGGRKLYVVWFRKTKLQGEEHSGYVIESAPALASWLKAHPDKRGEAPLFPAWGGSRMTRHGALHVVKSAAKHAGIQKRVYNHLFRHSRATHLLRSGLKEIEVKRLLGWAPGSQMLMRYAHLSQVDDYSAALRAQGLQPPKSVDLGRLALSEDRLLPVVPMNPGPARAPMPRDELEELLADPKVARFLQLLQAAKGS
jgi:site-specific recombinase XerD